jgi:hypothetical protein
LFRQQCIFVLVAINRHPISLMLTLPHSNAALTFTDFLAIVTTTDIGQSLEQEDQESSGHHAGVTIQT